MSERLTDEQFDSLEHAHGMTESEYEPRCRSVSYGSGCPGATDDSLAFWQKAHEMVPKMIAELRARRAAANARFDADAVVVFGGDSGKIHRVYITGREREILHALRGYITETLAPQPAVEHALAILDKLAAGGGK